MAKKDFKQGLDFLIQNTRENIENPNTPDKVEKDETGSQKATYYYNTQSLNTIKAIAWFDRKPIGHVIDEAINLYIKSYPDIMKVKEIYHEKSNQV